MGHQYGQDHSLFSFNLDFTPSGGLMEDITGSGSDSVGRYTIRGSCNRANGRLAFAKQYIPGTGNWRENKGHKVDYQGVVQGSLAAGVRGNWYVDTGTYSGTGNFHIWPESPPPPVATAVPIATATELGSVLTQPVSAMAIPMGTAVATNNNECVVCFKTYGHVSASVWAHCDVSRLRYTYA